ncbi:hypothetical protein GCM10029992_34400 [Glycomyces albus]
MSDPTTRLSSAKFQSGDNYRTADNLRIRQGLYEYKRPRHDMPAIVSAQIGGSPARILDVGCGNGRYLRRLRADHPDSEVIGVDKHEGILEDVPGPTTVADVVDLPFETGSADVVLAMHMLYHVPDIESALDELRRVLSPEGVLFVSTLAADDKAEYAQIFRDAGASVLGYDVGDPRRVVLDNFTLDRAKELLETRFGSVTVHDLDGIVELPEPGPLLDFYRSTQSFTGLDQDDFDRVMDHIERNLTDHFERSEVLSITSHPGILECRSPGA